MKCAGVATPVVASLLGHSEEVNRDYYTYDVTDILNKKKIVGEINANLIAKNG